jgi:hypothetical protein
MNALPFLEAARAAPSTLKGVVFSLAFSLDQ